MLGALETIGGVVAGLAAIGAVFWLTFRNPPPRGGASDTTAINRDAEYWAQNLNNDPSGHH